MATNPLKLILPKIALLIALAFVLTHCKENEEEPGPVECRRVSETAELRSMEYAYDGSKQLTGVNIVFPNNSQLNANVTIEYNSTGQITEIRTSEDVHSVFEYSGNNLIVDEHFSAKSPSGAQMLSNTHYEFDSNGRLIKFGSPETPDNYTRYEYYSNGNVSKVYQGTMGYEYLATEYISYDDKHNGMIPLTYLITSFDSNPLLWMLYRPAFSKNNPLEVNYYNMYEVLQGTASYEYEYNDEGFPLKATRTLPGASPETSIVTFAYNCK